MTDPVCAACEQNMHHLCSQHPVLQCGCAMNQHIRPYPERDYFEVRDRLDRAMMQLLEAAQAMGLVAMGCSQHDEPPMTEAQKAAAENGDDPCVMAFWPTPVEEPIMPQAPHHTDDPRMN